MRRAKHGSQGKPPLQGCFLRLKSRCGPPRGQSFYRTFYYRTDGESQRLFLPLPDPRAPFPFSRLPCPTHKARAGLGAAITLLSLQGVDKLGLRSSGGKQTQPYCGNKAAEAFFISQGCCLRKTLQLLASQECLVRSCRTMPACAGTDNCRPRYGMPNNLNFR